MSAIWQFMVKHEFWLLLAVFVVLFVAAEVTEDVLWANLGILVGMIAIARLAMHPMWKKDKRPENEGD